MRHLEYEHEHTNNYWYLVTIEYESPSQWSIYSIKRINDRSSEEVYTPVDIDLELDPADIHDRIKEHQNA